MSVKVLEKDESMSSSLEEFILEEITNAKQKNAKMLVVAYFIFNQYHVYSAEKNTPSK